MPDRLGGAGAMGSTTPASIGQNAVRRESGSVLQQAQAKQKSTTVEEIKRIDQNREQRRRAADEVRRSRQEEAAMLSAQCGGVVPDIDFHRMIREFRQHCQQASPLMAMDPNDPDSIIVCARKRPIQPFETQNRELDCVTACNPFAIIHERKFKVDGITKCLESHQFEFDFVFDEDTTTEEVYRSVTQPLVPWAIEQGGRATLFAYGQTGSGKTHTMTGIQRQLAEQIFDHIRTQGEQLDVSISFFEIYGGRPYDLLNGRQRLETLEDARNEVQIAGLTERAACSPEALLQCIELGNSLRTTHATAINRDSSRSHAICAVFLRHASGGSIHGKLTLVDLAGSERAADSKSSIRQRRVEGAQINKSLLALKECIRAMGDPREAHVPFRASKLTLVLRDAFVSRCPSKTVMIACISPGMTSADHSVNTLRYSDRLKDHPKAVRANSVLRASPDESSVDVEPSGRPRSVTKNMPTTEQRPPSRRRSPSPGSDLPAARTVWQSRPGSVQIAEMPREGDAVPSSATFEKDAGFDEAEDDDELVPLDPEDGDVTAGTPMMAWTGGEDQGGSVDSAALETRGLGGRQQVPRRGRQPTLRPNAPGGPNRPDALGSRSRQQDVVSSVGRVAPPLSTTPLNPQSAGMQERSSASGAAAAAGSTNSANIGAPLHWTKEGSPASGAPPAVGSASSTNNGATSASAVRSPRQRETSPGVNARAGDLCQEDNRYLHNTLTSEFFERHRGNDTTGVVDVGVEDLNDLAHMEALDEVRQWEDRIVSQHMVALQEDARLLTAESELLSQVQQTTNYDIDWYVSEVDKVVRRKMEVYQGFLEELEVFKAQLRREESLSRSCQRQRASVGGTAAAGFTPEGAGASAHPVRDMALSESTPQRTPRTPRTTAPMSTAAFVKAAELARVA